MGEVSVETNEDGTLRLVLRGEIDFTNANEIHKTFREAIADQRPPAVFVDLADVTFMDSTGISVLVDGMRAALDVEAEYRVQNPSQRLLDQLRTTGLAKAFGLT
ncbi:anti-sigma B factor antagonist [Nonomuraea solani]|uniref:Anti-sigma factor antagonist n=1 Tax=Nonomuraea solani TaxID=1144553 RepID=A0A1H6DVX7_9ACTN|nr:STAS domain-containing protein [Nonomuraea solani]SEG88886.1 anti-sigma B factor antagonist [Nonomuraea solani]